MATILSCGACHYPIIFKGIAPGILSEREHCIICPQCGAAYNLLIRMVREPKMRNSKLEIVRNRPT